MPVEWVEVNTELRRRVDSGIRGFEAWYLAEKGHRYLQAEEEGVLRALDLQPDSTVIDAGCGGGRFTLLAAARCRRVRAVDLSPVAVSTTLERAAQLGCSNVDGAVADIAQDIPGEPADRIVSVQTLMYMAGEERRRQALAALRRALRPGGRLVLTVFNGGRWMDRLRRLPRECVDPSQSWYYYYRFLASELRDLLSLTGFEEVKVRGLVNLPGRVYRWRAAAALGFADRLLGAGPWGNGLGIYLLASAVKPRDLDSSR